jgi:hypothetical protein
MAGIPPPVANEPFTDFHGRPDMMALADYFFPDTRLREVKYDEIHDTDKPFHSDCIVYCTSKRHYVNYSLLGILS